MKHSLKITGFYREYGQPTHPSLRDHTFGVVSENKDPILHYLKNGIHLMETRGSQTCALSGREIKNIVIYTDGDWIWTTEMIFYLEEFNLKIPDSLEAHITSKGFQPPAKDSLSEQQLYELAGKVDDVIFSRRPRLEI